MLRYHLLLPILFSLLVVLIPCDAQVARDCGLLGTILDGQNDPVSAYIAAYRLGVQQGKIVPVRECLARVDQEDHFRCAQLPSGTYVIVVNITRKIVREKGLSQDSAAKPLPLYLIYPSSFDLEPASLLHLNKGDIQFVNISVYSDVLSVLHIKAPTRAANRQLQIFLQGDDFKVPVLDIHETSQPSDSDYDVEGITPGTYTFTQSWSENDKRHEAVSSLIANQFSPNETSLNEVQFYNISGSVQYATDPKLRASEVVLIPTTSADSDRYVASVDKDGSFTFRNIMSGTYNVSFIEGDGLFVREVLAGGRSLQASTINISEGNSQLPLTLVASNASATITGNLELEGAEPKPGILVHSVDSHTNLIVPVDARGFFSVGSLAPGRYILYGWEDITNVPYDSPHYLARHVDKAVSFDIEDGSHLTGLNVECNKVDL